MTKDITYFLDIIEKQRKKFERFSPSNIAYGSNIIPILNLYNELSFDEKKIYVEALESLLISPDKKKQKFAIDICLGFVKFKNAIK